MTDVAYAIEPGLIRRTTAAAARHTTLVLVAAPKSRAYYPHTGMKPHDPSWVTPRAD
jgi:hypothetical protein